MSKFVISATVDDPKLMTDAKFEYRILDNSNYVIDKNGGVTTKEGYSPKPGDKFTVEVIYRVKGFLYHSVARKTFTVKI